MSNIAIEGTHFVEPDISHHDQNCVDDHMRTPKFTKQLLVRCEDQSTSDNAEDKIENVFKLTS